MMRYIGPETYVTVTGALMQAHKFSDVCCTNSVPQYVQSHHDTTPLNLWKQLETSNERVLSLQSFDSRFNNG